MGGRFGCDARGTIPRAGAKTQSAEARKGKPRPTCPPECGRTIGRAKRMVIVDSSVWIDYLFGIVNPQTNWLDAAVGKREIGLTSLILCEVLQGVRSQAQFRRLQRDLSQFPIFEILDTQLAIASARNYRVLRDRGITVRKT